MTTLHQRFLVTSFDSGFYNIPSLRFYYRQLPDTTIRFEQTKPLFLNVHSLAVDTTQAIKPIKGPIKVPLSFREILPWLLLAIGIILAILAILYYLKKRKKAEPVFQLRPRIELPAYQIALNEFEQLRLKKLWQQGKVKEYFTELTDILRVYLERRFSLMAMEMTSDEIMEALYTHKEIERNSYEDLKKILFMADLVKFAKMQPLPQENESTLSDAVSFVKMTGMEKEKLTTDV
jgi:hypothetical protein